METHILLPKSFFFSLQPQTSIFIFLFVLSFYVRNKHYVADKRLKNTIFYILD